MSLNPFKAYKSFKERKREDAEDKKVGARARTGAARGAAEAELRGLSDRLMHELSSLRSIEGSLAALEDQGFIDHKASRAAQADLSSAYANLQEAYGDLGGSVGSYHTDKKKGRPSKLGDYANSAAYDVAAILVLIGSLGMIGFIAPSVTGAVIGASQISISLLFPFIFSVITLIGVLWLMKSSR